MVIKFSLKKYKNDRKRKKLSTNEYGIKKL